MRSLLLSNSGFLFNLKQAQTTTCAQCPMDGVGSMNTAVQIHAKILAKLCPCHDVLPSGRNPSCPGLHTLKRVAILHTLPRQHDVLGRPASASRSSLPKREARHSSVSSLAHPNMMSWALRIDVDIILTHTAEHDVLSACTDFETILADVLTSCMLEGTTHHKSPFFRPSFYFLPERAHRPEGPSPAS